MRLVPGEAERFASPFAEVSISNLRRLRTLSASLFAFLARFSGDKRGKMEGFQDLALAAAAFLSLVWLHLHPSKSQRERAARTQELRDWDWRA